MGLTTEDLAYNIILASKSGDALPLRLSLTGTEYVLLYSPTNKRVERVLVDQFSNNAQAQIDQLNEDLLLKEDKSNKKNTFDIESTDFYPSIKAVVDYINDLKAVSNGLATLDSNGKIPTTQIPDLSITSILEPTETTISDFAVNSGNYTFEQGDVVIIDDNGNLSHYMYKGGDKTDVSEYSLLSSTEISISQVVGLQTALDDLTNALSNYVTLDTDQTITGRKDFIDGVTITDSSYGLTQNSTIDNRLSKLTYEKFQISWLDTGFNTYLGGDTGFRLTDTQNNKEVKYKVDEIVFNEKVHVGIGGTDIDNTVDDVDIVFQQKSGTIALTEGTVKKDGDNMTGGLVIDENNTDTNISGSVLTVKKESISTATNVNSFFDTDRNALSDNSADTYGLINRVVNNSNSDTGGIVGANNVGRHSGSGDVDYVYGALNTAEVNGSGHIPFIVSSSEQSKITGAGAVTVDYIRGMEIEIDNPNTTVQYAQSLHPSISVKNGNLVNGHVVYLDADYTGGVISGEWAYLRSGVDSDVMGALAGNTNAYYIHSEIELPSKLAGKLTTTAPITDIVDDGDYITKEYLDSILNPVVIKVGDVGAPSFENGWGNFSTSFGSLSYYKIGDIVHLQGMITGGSSASVITQLPLGFRPNKAIIADCKANGTVGRLDISVSGEVINHHANDTTGWISLQGVYFNINN